MATTKRSPLEKASWVAGIVGALIAAVALVAALLPAKEHPAQQQTGVGNNQIGSVGGNVTINAAPTPQPSLTGEASIPKIYGLSYDKARKLLVEAGWIPDMRRWQDEAEVTSFSGNSKIFWKRGFWEIESCAPTGMANCKFLFYDPAGRHLEVFTQGEMNEDSDPGAPVTDYSIKRKQE